jgi:hypothetical protein
MSFPVVSSSAISKPRKRYPAPSWPIAELAISDAFVIPMKNRHDQDGRSEQYVRLVAWKIAERLGYQVSVNKLDNGDLAVTRVA